MQRGPIQRKVSQCESALQTPQRPCLGVCVAGILRPLHCANGRGADFTAQGDLNQKRRKAWLSECFEGEECRARVSHLAVFDVVEHHVAVFRGGVPVSS